MKYKLILPALVAVMSGAALLGATTTFAQNTSSGQQTIVQKLAQRFNLSESDVQAVFDEDRAAHHAQMQAQFEAKLSADVQAGKLTEEQKQKIIAKMNELHQQRQKSTMDFKSMTPAEHQAQHQKVKTELEQWAKDNGIDPQYLHFGKMGKGLGRDVIKFRAPAR
jgi:ABC-type glycerol-3-phosphate transport system substrate-binding protein